jgi:hypothetical protein
LISRPELYHEKPVRVIGFVNLEFEGNGLYLHEDDWRHSIYRNGIWIDPPPGIEPDSGGTNAPINRQYVLVEGVFDASNHGHMGMWSGALHSVTRFDPWKRHDAPIQVPGLPPQWAWRPGAAIVDSGRLQLIAFVRPRRAWLGDFLADKATVIAITPRLGVSLHDDEPHELASSDYGVASRRWIDPKDWGAGARCKRRDLTKCSRQTIAIR